MADGPHKPGPDPRPPGAPARVDPQAGPVAAVVNHLGLVAPSPGEFLHALYQYARREPADAAAVLRGQYAHHPNPHGWAHDLEVITAFVNSYHMSTTRRRYLLELQRLVLWALIQRAKPPSGLVSDDAAAYAQFLGQPVAARGTHKGQNWWHGPTVRRFLGEGEQRRPNVRWRPFGDRTMSEASRQHCLTVLEAFFNYAVDEGYLAINVFRRRGRQTLAAAENRRVADRVIGFGDFEDGGGPRRGAPPLLASAPAGEEELAPSTEPAGGAAVNPSAYTVERYLPPEAWQWLRAYIDALPRQSAQEVARFHQWRFCVAGMYATAARIDEWANHYLSDFRWGDDGRLFWDVTGKGRSQPTAVAVLSWFGPILQETRAYLGLAPVAQPGEQVPLAFSLEPGIGQSDYAGRPVRQGIGARHLRERIEAVFRLAATAAEDPAIAARLAHATPHWLRHSVISHLINDANNPRNPRDVMQFARHKNINTTLLYLHKEQNEHHDHIDGRLTRERVDWGGG